MRKLPYLLSILLLIIVTLLSSTESKASSSKDESKNKELVAAYRSTVNGLVPLSNAELSELKRDELTNNENKKDALNKSIVTPSQLPQYVYKQDGFVSENLRSDKQRRISEYVVNLTQDNVERSISASTTQTWSANISLNAGKKDALTVTLGGGWSKSTDWSDTIKATIRPKYKCWIEFAPIMDNSFGRMLYGTTDEFVDLYIAREVGGRTDGVYYVYTALN